MRGIVGLPKSDLHAKQHVDLEHVEGSIEEWRAAVDSTYDDGTSPTVWLTDDKDDEETPTPRKRIQLFYEQAMGY
ncbi:hypothetical protein Pyn_09236 [Prunus yedoensis var. nudiflora]|uniref:Uncharacterized protein n=1 Tax=Prunus yedoensis var. nudiflora TaxID=2094558 RepID=A0A314XLW3_PRUYE|nr:hypothetical protein Pyn_09236 [Prunus yedoensis var. nudiflora]